MAGLKHRVLLVTSDVECFDRMMPLLERNDVHVTRMLRGDSALKLAHSVQLDVIIVVHPLKDLDSVELIKAVRDRASPCRSAGVVVLAVADELEKTEALRDVGANRVLPVDSTAKDLSHVLGDLLGVAVRTQLRTVLRVEMAGRVGRKLLMCQTENISRSGLLVRGPTNLQIGTLLDFEFRFPGYANPVRGVAKVTRHTSWPREKVKGFGAVFVSFNNDGREMVEAFIDSQVL